MLIPSRREIVEEVKSRGQRIAAVLPIHYPRPLLRAAGFHPIEVWGPPHVDPTIGNAHFQAYTCAIVRHAASFLVSEAATVADLILVPHTCDSLQGLGSVLIDFIAPRQPVLTLYHARGRRECDVEFTIAELKRLASALVEAGGEAVDEETLTRELEVEGRLLQTMRGLALHRDDFAICDRDFYTLLRSWEFLPPERFCALAEQIPRGTPPGERPIRLMISGIVPEPLEIFDRLNDVGARIVADDLACLSRRLYKTADVDYDPWRRLALMMLGMPPEPTVGSPIPQRIDHLLRRLDESRAQGLLVYDVKFCEPELFDLPLVKQALGERGFSVLHLEVELGLATANQTLTRIEAFVETLQ
ncbi:MAG: 2-hydroxyacyl-CoA dehydratase [Myxococcales bacterium]|nr:2-hydroxyacyl-CoA dehydratase [Myxococcales bacterium]